MNWLSGLFGASTSQCTQKYEPYDPDRFSNARLVAHLAGESSQTLVRTAPQQGGRGAALERSDEAARRESAARLTAFRQEAEAAATGAYPELPIRFPLAPPGVAVGTAAPVVVGTAAPVASHRSTDRFRVCPPEPPAENRLGCWLVDDANGVLGRLPCTINQDPNARAVRDIRVPEGGRPGDRMHGPNDTPRYNRYDPNLFRTETLSSQPRVQTGLLVNAHTGRVYQTLEDDMPPPNTDKEIPRERFAMTNPKLIQMFGGIDPNLPLPRKTEVIEQPPGPDDGPNVFGDQIFAERRREELRARVERDVWNNRNGEVAVEAVDDRRPVGYVGFQPAYRPLPKLHSTQRATLGDTSYTGNPDERPAPSTAREATAPLVELRRPDLTTCPRLPYGQQPPGEGDVQMAGIVPVTSLPLTQRQTTHASRQGAADSVCASSEGQRLAAQQKVGPSYVPEDAPTTGAVGGVVSGSVCPVDPGSILSTLRGAAEEAAGGTVDVGAPGPLATAGSFVDPATQRGTATAVGPAGAAHAQSAGPLAAPDGEQVRATLKAWMAECPFPITFQGREFGAGMNPSQDAAPRPTLKAAGEASFGASNAEGPVATGVGAEGSELRPSLKVATAETAPPVGRPQPSPSAAVRSGESDKPLPLKGAGEAFPVGSTTHYASAGPQTSEGWDPRATMRGDPSAGREGQPDLGDGVHALEVRTADGATRATLKSHLAEQARPAGAGEADVHASHVIDARSAPRPTLKPDLSSDPARGGALAGGVGDHVVVIDPRLRPTSAERGPLPTIAASSHAQGWTTVSADASPRSTLKALAQEPFSVGGPQSTADLGGAVVVDASVRAKSDLPQRPLPTLPADASSGAVGAVHAEPNLRPTGRASTGEAPRPRGPGETVASAGHVVVDARPSATLKSCAGETSFPTVATLQPLGGSVVSVDATRLRPTMRTQEPPPSGGAAIQVPAGTTVDGRAGLRPTLKSDLPQQPLPTTLSTLPHQGHVISSDAEVRPTSKGQQPSLPVAGNAHQTAAHVVIADASGLRGTVRVQGPFPVGAAQSGYGAGHAVSDDAETRPTAKGTAPPHPAMGPDAGASAGPTVATDAAAHLRPTMNLEGPFPVVAADAGRGGMSVGPGVAERTAALKVGTQTPFPVAGVTHPEDAGNVGRRDDLRPTLKPQDPFPVRAVEGGDASRITSATDLRPTQKRMGEESFAPGAASADGSARHVVPDGELRATLKSGAPQQAFAAGNACGLDHRSGHVVVDAEVRPTLKSGAPQQAFAAGNAYGLDYRSGHVVIDAEVRPTLKSGAPQQQFAVGGAGATDSQPVQASVAVHHIQPLLPPSSGYTQVEHRRTQGGHAPQLGTHAPFTGDPRDTQRQSYEDMPREMTLGAMEGWGAADPKLRGKDDIVPETRGAAGLSWFPIHRVPAATEDTSTRWIGYADTVGRREQQARPPTAKRTGFHERRMLPEYDHRSKREQNQRQTPTRELTPDYFGGAE